MYSRFTILVIYVVLASGMQQSDSACVYIYTCTHIYLDFTYIFRLYSDFSYIFKLYIQIIYIYARILFLYRLLKHIEYLLCSPGNYVWSLVMEHENVRKKNVHMEKNKEIKN